MTTVTITAHELRDARSEDELHELAEKRGIDFTKPFEQWHDPATGNLHYEQKDDLRL